MNSIFKILILCLLAFCAFGCSGGKVYSGFEKISYQGLNPKEISQLFVNYDSGDSSLNRSKELNFPIPHLNVSPRKGNKKPDVCDLVNDPLVMKYFSSKIRRRITEVTRLSDFASSNRFFHPAVHEYNVLRTWNLGKSDFFYDGGDVLFEGKQKSSFGMVEFEDGGPHKDRYAVEMNFLYMLNGNYWQLVDVEVHYIEYEYTFTLLSRELDARIVKYLKYQKMNMPTN